MITLRIFLVLSNPFYFGDVIYWVDQKDSLKNVIKIDNIFPSINLS